MSRPKLTERVTLRIPEELLADLNAQAERRGVSMNEVALCCFENDLARMGTYRIDYYTQFRPLLAIGLGDDGGQFGPLNGIGGQCGKLADK